MDILSFGVLTVTCVIFVYMMYFFIDLIKKSHLE